MELETDRVKAGSTASVTITGWADIGDGRSVDLSDGKLKTIYAAASITVTSVQERFR